MIAKKEENGTAKYIVTINIKESHLTPNIDKQMKDDMNETNIQIPVDKEFYDSVQEGSVLDNSSRFGSFLMEGSVGNWDIKVKKKEVK